MSPRPGPFCCLLAVSLACCSTSRADAPPLREFSSARYTVSTNLPPTEAAPWARHMDAVHDEYARRFAGFSIRQDQPNALYLLRTQDDYQALLKSRKITAGNSGGLFVVRDKFSGLITWTQDKSRATTLATLQHEGFHQFAFRHFGPNLPVWANEGLASYFEDGLLVGGKLHLGSVNSRRITLVRQALDADRAATMDRLLTISDDDWRRDLHQDTALGAINYAQAWSLCHFLIHADNGRYRPAFEQYLRLVADGRESDRAFRAAFGSSDLTPLARRWEQYVRSVEPDPLTLTLDRLEFLGQGLLFLHSRGQAMPRSFDDLRKTLAAMQYTLTLTSSDGVVSRFEATRPEHFQYPLRAGTVGKFELLEPARADLPPRILARGLKPEPTLVWSRDGQGQLVQDIEFR